MMTDQMDEKPGFAWPGRHFAYASSTKQSSQKYNYIISIYVSTVAMNIFVLVDDKVSNGKKLRLKTCNG